VIVWLATAALAQALPVITTRSLSGLAIELPASPPAERTVLLLGFRRSHQADFELWRTELGPQRHDGEVDWLELPFLDVPGLLEGIIGGAMNRSISDPVVRDRFAPVWASADPVRDALHIATDQQMVLVVVRAGEVTLRLDGPPTAQARADLAAALSATP
jgi:hypothetical protein